MKIQSIALILTTIVGTANAANKRRRVVKIYTQDRKISAERKLRGSNEAGNFDPFIGTRQLEEGSMSMGLTPAEMSMSMGLTLAEMSMSTGFLTPAEASMSMGLVPAESEENQHAIHAGKPMKPMRSEGLDEPSHAGKAARRVL